jgi:hypothetical protein
MEGTELLAATQHGYWAVMNKLQEAGVDPYRKDEHSYRVLVRLVYKNDLVKVNQLIESGAALLRVFDNDISVPLVKVATMDILGS